MTTIQNLESWAARMLVPMKLRIFYPYMVRWKVMEYDLLSHTPISILHVMHSFICWSPSTWIFSAKHRLLLVQWLTSLVPSLNLPINVTDGELRACLSNGTVLCQILNKLRHGTVNVVTLFNLLLTLTVIGNLIWDIPFSLDSLM